MTTATIDAVRGLSGHAIPPGDRLATLERLTAKHDATITLEGVERHITYRVEAAVSNGWRRVSRLYGPDNSAHYVVVGFLRDGVWRRRGAPEDRAFAWFTRHPDDERCAVYLAGSCRRCGRPLTTPESIRAGIGPVCAGRESLWDATQARVPK